jgi:predicted small lipoprotein YifL
LDRRHFIVALAAGLGLAACGRRGPLEPPPYTAQGREWNRRQGRNPDGTPRRAGEQQQGSVQEGLNRDRDERTTRDLETDIERNRTEGVAGTPSDPTQSEPGASPTPTASPTGARRRPPGIVPPKQSFILDPLL